MPTHIASRAPVQMPSYFHFSLPTVYHYALTRFENKLERTR